MRLQWFPYQNSNLETAKSKMFILDNDCIFSQQHKLLNIYILLSRKADPDISGLESSTNIKIIDINLCFLY